MKSKELLLSVREMLIGAMQDYPFPASDGGHGDLQVFLHGLPEDQRGTYPFICIRWASGGIDEGMEGAEGRQEQAGLLLAELLDWLRAVLRRNRVVAKKFELQYPLKSSMPEPDRQWIEHHYATVYPEYQYVIPSIPLGGTLKEHTYE